LLEVIENKVIVRQECAFVCRPSATTLETTRRNGQVLEAFNLHHP